MSVFRNLSITFKLIIFSAVIAAVFVGTAFLYALLNMRAELAATELELLESEVAAERAIIERASAEIADTLLSIRGTPPLQGMFRAERDGGFDAPGNSTYEEWRSQLAVIFGAEMESQGLYQQMRYIDENGDEIVRVNYARGSAMRAEGEALQNKSDRDYFEEANAMERDGAYVSRAELNREGSPPIISTPPTPVMRYAIPVFDDATGARKGIVIANALFDEIIAGHGRDARASAERFMIDREGYYLLHPNEHKEWGAPQDRATGENFFTDFPHMREIAGAAPERSVLNDEDIFVFAIVRPNESDPSHEWMLVERIPRAAVYGPIDMIVRNAALVGLGLFLALFFVFTLLVRRLLGPLNALSLGAAKLGRGDFAARVPIRAHDEIGRVALAFNAMAARLQELYASLEKKVEEKTGNLNEKVHELEKAQHVLTNVLEDIKTQREKTEAILKSIGDGVFVVGVDHVIQAMNPVAAKLCGCAVEDALGRPYKDVLTFIYEKDGTINDRFVVDAIETGEVQEMANHTLLVRPDGAKIPVADSAAPLKDERGRVYGCVVVFRDVSREHAVDKAKTEFVSLASHQLRTPLTAINWNLELLREDLQDRLDGEAMQSFDDLYQSSRRMAELVTALLNVSRIELGTFSVDPETVDIVALVKDVIKDLRPRIDEKKLRLAEAYDPDTLVMDVDPKLMRMVIENLLSNAVKYTPPEKDIGIGISARDAELCIEVRDEGWGIPESQKEKIFTRLFRADNVRGKDVEGTGLGLYLAKSIVEHSGGSIRFESKENEGTTFYVQLPLRGMRKKGGARKLG